MHAGEIKAWYGSKFVWKNEKLVKSKHENIDSTPDGIRISFNLKISVWSSS